jgi:hypothetical protein
VIIVEYTHREDSFDDLAKKTGKTINCTLVLLLLISTFSHLCCPGWPAAQIEKYTDVNKFAHLVQEVEKYHEVIQVQFDAA